MAGQNQNAVTAAAGFEIMLQRFIEDPLSEALIGGQLLDRPAFLEVYLDNNQLYYRPVGKEGEERTAEGVLLSSS